MCVHSPITATPKHPSSASPWPVWLPLGLARCTPRAQHDTWCKWEGMLGGGRKNAACSPAVDARPPALLCSLVPDLILGPGLRGCSPLRTPLLAAPTLACRWGGPVIVKEAISGSTTLLLLRV